MGAWVGQTAFAAACTTAADAGFAERTVVRALVEMQAGGWAGDDEAVTALVAALVDALVARLS